MTSIYNYRPDGNKPRPHALETDVIAPPASVRMSRTRENLSRIVWAIVLLAVAVTIVVTIVFSAARLGGDLRGTSFRDTEPGISKNMP